MFLTLAITTAMVTNPHAATIALVEHQMSNSTDSAYALVESINLTDEDTPKLSLEEMLEYLEADSIDY